MAPQVEIIILNWNGWRETILCVSSLELLDYSDYKTTIVDNASTDDSLERLREHLPEVSLIVADQNHGYAGGNNLGLERVLRTKAEYVWILNNDTSTHPRSLSHLVAYAEAHPDAGAVGNKVLHSTPPYDLQACGGGFVNFLTGRAHMKIDPTSQKEIDFVSGASLLLRTQAIRDVGFLDASFFMYWEDVDYSFRLKEAGWQLGVASDALVWHKGKMSFDSMSGEMEMLFNQSATQFFRQHSRVSWVPVLLGTTARVTRRILTRKWLRAGYVAKGAIAGWNSGHSRERG